ncbi:MAG: HAD-IB family hydrolase [Chryseolinea sp.]
MHLVLFDFDGTLTRKDTFIEFIKFYKGRSNFITGIIVLSPLLAVYKLKLIPNWRAKEILFGYFFKGVSKKEFQDKGRAFALKIIPSLIRTSALACIEKYKASGQRMVIVTASAEEWIKPWSDQFGIEIISTRWEFQNDYITGRILGRNCYGPEKRNRIEKEIDLSKYNSISVYGDTSGDREMLELGTEKFYKLFTD